MLQDDDRERAETTEPLNLYTQLPCGRTAIEVISAALRAFGLLKPGRVPASAETDALIPYLEEVLKDEKVAASYAATVSTLAAKAAPELAPRYQERQPYAKVTMVSSAQMDSLMELHGDAEGQPQYLAEDGRMWPNLPKADARIFSPDELGKAVYEKHYARGTAHVEWRCVIDKEYWVGLGHAAIDFYLKSAAKEGDARLINPHLAGKELWIALGQDPKRWPNCGEDRQEEYRRAAMSFIDFYLKQPKVQP